MRRAQQVQEGIPVRKARAHPVRPFIALTGVLVLLGGAGVVHSAHAGVWHRPATGTDLWYSGFLHAEGSYTDVTGSVYEYEEGYFRGREDTSLDMKGAFHANGLLRRGLTVNSTVLFDTRYRRYPQRYWDRRFWDTFRMKLVMDKPRQPNDRWQFHAKADYDREDQWRDDYPDARLLMEPIDDARLEAFAHLESDHVILEGGDLKPDYDARGFVLYQRDILGLHGNAHNDAVATDLTAGRVKGTTFLQTPDDSLGIRADGTTGPYHLAHAPIVRGSEVVAVEVRDRFDPTILQRRTTQRRNVDYTIDYLRGVLTFMEPIESETFEGNPIYISIQYSFDERETGYRRYLAATRTQLKLGERASAGILYAGVYDDAGSWRGDESGRPAAQRLAAYGGVLQADLLERTSIEATAALSDSGRLGDDEDNTAFGLALESHSIPRLDLKGDFQRIEYGFEPLDNRTLTGQRNRQRLDLEGRFRAASAVDLLGGERLTESANPEYDAAAYTDRATYAGLAYRPFARTELGYRHEWRTAVDEKTVHLKDEYRETSTLEARQELGTSKVRLAAEREHFTNDGQVAADALARSATWRLRGALDFVPRAWLNSNAELHTEAIRDRDDERMRARQDRAKLGAQLRFAEQYVLRGNGEWRTDYALDDAGWKFTGGDPTTKRSAYSAGADLRPLDPVQVILGYDREKTRDETTQSVQRQSELTRAEGYWFATPDLELHAAGSREDLRDARKIGIAQGLLRRHERRYEADVTYNLHTQLSVFAGYQWKLRRLYDIGRSDTEVQNLRLGVNWHLHERWELTGRVRYTLLDGEPVAWTDESTSIDEALENHRWIGTGEIAWDASRMFRFALGYETLEYDVDSEEDSPDSYAADRFYVKAIQKF
jgi:hypothetical protein